MCNIFVKHSQPALTILPEFAIFAVTNHVILSLPLPAAGKADIL
jgi:hypothetical protein